MGYAELESTGKINYHLKALGDLITKTSTGQYALTEKGVLAAQFLLTFPEKKKEPSNLRMADASLIGLCGVALIVANPLFWFGVFVALQDKVITVNAMPIFSLCNLLYSVFVPSLVMWMLAVRRAHSHDMYDLLKPSLVAFVLLVLFIAVMLLAHVNVTAELYSEKVAISEHSYSQAMITLSLLGQFIGGVVNVFLGIILIEGVARLRKKLQQRK
jgi:hypothetical protein